MRYVGQILTLITVSQHSLLSHHRRDSLADGSDAFGEKEAASRFFCRAEVGGNLNRELLD